MAASEEAGKDAGVATASQGVAAASAGSVAGQASAAQPSTHGPSERFDEILVRLRSVVEKLEGGNLSLEDSLKFFEEGIGLCRRGATILDSAERKVEVLLGGSSSGKEAGKEAGRDASTTAPRTVPFDGPASDED